MCVCVLGPRRDICSSADRLTVCAAIVAIQQTCGARTIQLALRQSLKDPIVRGLSNYGNLINLFCSSPLTAFVSAWDLLRDLCEPHPFVGVHDEESAAALFSRNRFHFEEVLKISHLRLWGSVLGSFVVSALNCSSLPCAKSIYCPLTGWNCLACKSLAVA